MDKKLKDSNNLFEKESQEEILIDKEDVLSILVEKEDFGDLPPPDQLWENDYEKKNCSCGAVFSFFVRKHHCRFFFYFLFFSCKFFIFFSTRLCKLVYCSGCCENFVSLPIEYGYGESKVRVCKICDKKLQNY